MAIFQLENTFSERGVLKINLGVTSSKVKTYHYSVLYIPLVGVSPKDGLAASSLTPNIL